MTIAVDVTYAVLAHDIPPDRRIRANSCIEISKYDELVPTRYLHKRGSQHCIAVILVSSWDGNLGADVLMKVAYRCFASGILRVIRRSEIAAGDQAVSEGFWCE